MFCPELLCYHRIRVKEPGKMPSVLVVPVYVEVPDGFERAVTALEAHLRRAGYAFYTASRCQYHWKRRKELCLRDKRQGRAVATSQKDYLLESWDLHIC